MCLIIFRRLNIINIIDDRFIKEWHQKYEKTEHDEPAYRRLLDIVSLEREALLTLTKETFTEILYWKLKNDRFKIIERIERQNFDIYSYAIKRCHEVSGMERMKILVDLPGIGAPVASTFLQFIFPSYFPIIDQRTVGVLKHFNYIKSKYAEIAQYPAFMEAIFAIQKNCCTQWSLREIDRAIFAYHKNNRELFGSLSKPKSYSTNNDCNDC